MNFSYSQASGWKRGDIRIWTRSLSEIPHGWQLCDGTNGTPNMLNRAVVGAGDSYQHGEIFGSDWNKTAINIDSYTLSQAQMPAHTHTLIRRAATGGGNNSGTTGTDGNFNLGNTPVPVAYAGSNGAHKHTANMSNVDVRQQSVAVYWIMKIR
ncbi:hypothetical protein [Vibrio spartinae]|uniref:Phage Tail Collar Domain protein n=1 Tax=Vibrio spartinae TaxID=1918945 RepID=A0A1N6MB49_9VIBR|nr:hypothetical protein [Vibrio spartinae]SIO96685.1 hypothetical protein VSP9026_04491 [Vibrio spartinae]